MNSTISADLANEGGLVRYAGKAWDDSAAHSAGRKSEIFFGELERMKIRQAILPAVAAVILASSAFPAIAGKKNDTLTWLSNSEPDTEVASA